MSSFSPRADLVRRIHDAAPRAVLAATGGGGLAIGDLLAVAGASRTVLEAIVPYSSAALVEFLGGRPEQFCSSHTARQMAMAAFRRAEKLLRLEEQNSAPFSRSDVPIVGLGCTASLASDRPKHGPHRVHMAAQSAKSTWSRSLELAKEVRSREAEERLVADVLLDLLAETCAISSRPALELRPDEALVARRTDAQRTWFELLRGERLRTDERPGFGGHGEPTRVLFPGSFHPLHTGHRHMAEIAARKLGAPVHYELSIENVEKPPLDYEEMADRGCQFSADTRVWYTRAPRMKQKAALFPGATIVIGVDTLLRVADPKFAGDDEAERDRDLAEIASHGGQFLVFGRTTPRGFETLDDVELPEALRRLCTGVPESEFHEEVSSTELRLCGENLPFLRRKS